MRKRLGDSGEKIACKFLKKNGFKILEKNYRAVRGEIDIIGRDHDCLVFVEVKTSSAPTEVPPELRVNNAKQMQIGKIAGAYLQEKKITDMDCRFDVVGVLIDEKGKSKVSHIKNAFWLPADI